MKILILSILGALILLGVGVYIVFYVSERDKIEGKSFFRLENRWLYGFLGYASVIIITFLVLILQTSLTRQEKTLENTQARFQQELTAFRERLGEQTDRLMSQINEKAELTGSEVEVRGKLSNEIAHHQRTHKERDAAREQLRLTQSELNRETLAHRAYLDSLNTERSLHASTQNRLKREEEQHAKSRETLRTTRQKLDRANERLNVQNRQITALRNDLKRAQDNASSARQMASRLLQQSDDHQRALITLQATVDSLFLKEFKRPRIPSNK
jgi:chromosome segregation ATPase